MATKCRTFIALALTLVLCIGTTIANGHHGSRYFYKGYDLSSLKIMEDNGNVYKDAQDGNVTKPVEDILVGMNTVRLRLWVHPVVPYDDGYYETYNIEYVMALAKRFSKKGYHIYLDYRKRSIKFFSE